MRAVATEDLPSALQGEGCILHLQALPARARATAAPRCPLPPALSAALAASGVSALYAHQAAALDALSEGRDVLCTTGTGSGKSLVFLLPVLSALLSSAAACALFLFPTKALLNDQLLALEELLRHSPPLAAHVRARVLSGDTPFAEREGVRAEANLLFATLDIVSAHLLPTHAGGWGRFLAGLRFLILDEAHVYRGVFGAAAVQALARLRRVCAHHQRAASAPPLRTIACSATVRNPEALFDALVGPCERGLCILGPQEDGSPSGVKTLVVWQPPVLHGGAEGGEAAAPRQGKRARVEQGTSASASAAGGSSSPADLERILWEVRARQDREEEEDAWPCHATSCLEASTLALALTVSPALAAFLRDPQAVLPMDVFGAVVIPPFASGEGGAGAGGKPPPSALAAAIIQGPPRRPAIDEAARLTVLLLRHDKRVIVFARTRKIVDLLTELIHCRLRDAAAACSAGKGEEGAASALLPPSSIVSYRAGFTAETRRATEAALREGSIRAVVATCALELGLDVGGLDCAVLVGHPGSVSSLWQQVGRAGRGTRPGTAFIVCTNLPHCRALLRDPAEVLARAPEAAAVPFSSLIAKSHLLAAAAELPISEAEMGAGASVFSGAAAAAALSALVREGELVPEAPSTRRGAGARAAGSVGSVGGSRSFVSRGWVPRTKPSGFAPMRGLQGKEYDLVQGGAGGEGKVEVMEASRVRLECIPPPFSPPAQHYRSIITSRGARYSVEGVNHEQGLVTLYHLPPRQATYHTRPMAFTCVNVCAAPTARPSAGCAMRCLVRVTTTVLGITAVDTRSGETTAAFSPKPTLHTSEAVPAVCWNVPHAALLGCLDLPTPCHPLTAVHSAAHALLRVVPLHLLCEHGDLDTEHGAWESQQQPARPARVVLYEPVECGLAAAASGAARALVSAARDLLTRCPCANGCIECLLSHRCASGLSKAGALLILEALQGT